VKEPGAEFDAGGNMDRRNVLGLLTGVPFAGLFPGVAVGEPGSSEATEDRVVENLIRGLEAAEVKDRGWAINELSRLGTRAAAALPALTRLLTDENETVRALSAYAVGKIVTDEEEAVAGLLRLLSHPVNSSRSFATLSLSCWLSRGVPAPGLVRRVVDAVLAVPRDPSPAVRAGLLTVLGDTKSGEPRVLAALVAGLVDPEEEVRRAAIDALKRFGAASQDAREQAEAALRNLEQEAGTE
jgi:hypothetical protein